MDCDDAFWEEFLQTGFAQDSAIPVSRELHNDSSLTTFVTAELPLEIRRLPGVGSKRSPSGDVQRTTSLASISGLDGDHNLSILILG